MSTKMGKESCEKMRFFIIVGVLQVIFLVLFGVFAEYDNKASPKHNATDGNSEIEHYYPMFQDVHVMMFIGFGFLMTFLKRYGFGSVGFNMMLAAFVLQWATLMGGFLHMIPVEGHSTDKIAINLETLLFSDFTAATVLISMGAVLGKVSALQLIIMALFEVVFFKVNEWIGLEKLSAADVGGSMFVHVFGAYFGIAAGRMIHKRKDLEKAESKEGSVYHSDMFAMIGTIFLWLFWPSFNSAVAADEDDRYRAIIHTYFSLASCTVTTFIFSSLTEKGKFDMVHVQNATLAGGVAVGAVADLNIHPWGAILLGVVSGTISVLGYRYITPFMARRLALHDTCGVNNLHGMPGVLAGIAGIIVAAMASVDDYGSSRLLKTIASKREYYAVAGAVALYFLLDIYGARVDGRSAGGQAGYQALALVVTLAISIVGGIITGLILRIPFLDRPQSHQIFDDTDYWNMPDEGFPSSGDHHGYTPAIIATGSTEHVANGENKDGEVTKV